MDKTKLAIFGGECAVTIKRPHFIWPEITDNTKQAVLAQLNESISIYDRSGVLARLENKLTQYFNLAHALLTNSGTCALYSMFVGAGISKGDEIICPAYTFFATVTPLLFTGAIPILADCDANGNIDPEEIKKKISNRTKAIVVTHMWGVPCQMDKIQEIALKNNLFLFEDISHAFGAEFRGKKVGTFGVAAACSLQGQKTLTGGEGGFLATGTPDIFYKALLLGHYNKRCNNEIPKDFSLSSYSVTGMGLKFRMHPVAAAIVEEQLTQINNFLLGRELIARKLIRGLQGIPGIEVPSLDEDLKRSWYSFVIKYKPEELGGLSRERFYEALKAEGCIELDIPNSTSPLNLLTLFQKPSALFPEYTFSYKKGDFPKAETFYLSILKLPVWHRACDEKIVDQYVAAFKKVTGQYKRLL